MGVAGASLSDCAFLGDVSYNENLADQPEGVTKSDYKTLAKMRLAEDHSFPYRESLMGKPFPFENVLEEHWGNWPESLSLTPMLVYYEYYSDGSFGLYGTGQTKDGLVTIDTLDGPNGGMVIVEDGYALLTTFSIRGFEYSLNGGATQRLEIADTQQSGSFVRFDISSVDFWDGSATHSLSGINVYQLPFELQMPDRTASTFLDTLELSFADAGGTSAETFTYYYNPDFAMLSSSPAFGEQVAEVPNTDAIFIRTARHLNRLGYQSAYWASNAHIVQYYDIDVPSYTNNYLGHALDLVGTGDYHNQPIGRIGEPFAGLFDGAGHAIIDYNQWVYGEEAAGLFGCVSGTIQKTHLAASSLGSAQVVRSGAVPGGTLAAGALVGWLDGGTLVDCSASAYSVFLDGSSSIGDAAVGGLVGVNQGLVSRSTAADVTVTLVSQSPASASLGVGGLVGGLQGTVADSYAVNNTLVGQMPDARAGCQLAQGGIAGIIYGSGASVANCYGYAFAEDTITSDGYATHFDITDSSACSVANCYRLKWDGGLDTGAQDGDDVVACDSDALKNANLGSAFVRDDYAPTYGSAYIYGDVRVTPGHLTVSRWSYPYPLVCTDYDGNYSHFGFDWWE